MVSNKLKTLAMANTKMAITAIISKSLNALVLFP
jgi:hypothetical protein